MEVHWNDQLLVRPHEQNQLISLTGGAEVKFQGINQLKAEQIHFWLLELPEQRSSQSKLQPDRMLALGNVKMSTPQFSAAVKRMEVWFKQLSPPPVGPAANMVGAWGSRPTAPAEMASPQRPAGPAAAIQPAGPEMVMRKEDSPIFADTKIGTVPGTAAQTDLNPPHAQQHLEITGSLLRAHVLMIDQGSQQSSELSELMVEENVHLAETQTALPTEKPLLITGSLLKVTDANRPTSVVHVLGQPAHFEGRGMSLTGPDINLDRGVNLLWIDGPGRMDLPVDRDPEGRPLAAQPKFASRLATCDALRRQQGDIRAIGGGLRSRPATADQRHGGDASAADPLRGSEDGAAAAGRGDFLPQRRPAGKQLRSIRNSKCCRKIAWR